MAAVQLAGEAQAGTEPGPSGMWGTPGVQPPPRHAVLQLPFTYPASHGASLLPRPLGRLAQPVPAASALQPLLCAPCFGQGLPAAPPRPRMPASRDSTRALKAWLGQHRRRPYPSRGEKVALALLSSMSLTQVSTWFANARRRLRKEQQARGSPCREPGPQPEGRKPPQPQLWRLAETAAAPWPEPDSRLCMGGPPPCGDHGAPEWAGGAMYILPPHLSLALPWGPESHWQLPL